MSSICLNVFACLRYVSVFQTKKLRDERRSPKSTTVAPSTCPHSKRSRKKYLETPSDRSEKLFLKLQFDCLIYVSLTSDGKKVGVRIVLWTIVGLEAPFDRDWSGEHRRSGIYLGFPGETIVPRQLVSETQSETSQAARQQIFLLL